MKLKVLDEKKENNAKCYLCKINLIDYINEIPQDYLEWDIQRGIVPNGYLDSLANTIENKVHIPTIVLTANEINFNSLGNNQNIEIVNFKILDGLQRTHRLKVISDSIQLIQKEENLELSKNPAKFARSKTKEIKVIGSNSTLIKYLLKLGLTDIGKSKLFFSDNYLWVEVWVGLKDDQKVKKMLMLNAGHKSVSIKHQLELLFSGIYLDFEKILPVGVSVQREKDQSSIQYSKFRNVGVYNFSHLISALISLSACKAVNTNSNFVSELQSDDLQNIDLFEGFNLETLQVFIKYLNALDIELNINYPKEGIKWIGREVVLVGMFGAIGSAAKNENSDVCGFLEKISKDVKRISLFLDLINFEKVRNSVEFNKVNIGNVNKNAVFRAFSDILILGKFKSWEYYFEVESK